MTENNTRNEIVNRLGFVYLAILLFALGVIGRVVYLQFWEHDKWANANTVSQKDIIIEPERGDICAYDGRILATSVPRYEVRMDLKCAGLTDELFNKNVDSLSWYLSNLFRDKSAQQYKRMFVSARYRGARYQLIKRGVDYIELKQIKTFPLFRLGQYKGGLIVNQEYKRVQPFVNLASRTIGYENKGGTNVGIEGAYNAELTGERGVRMVQRIAGNYWMPINDGSEIEPRNGYDVITALDVNLQDVAHHALSEQLKKHSASHGTAVLMEVETGDVKAIVNLKRDNAGYYNEDYNYAVAQRTEPGSTFKLASLMVALEDGFIDLGDSVDTGNGTVRYHDHVVNDSHKGGYGKITVKQALELSSNVAVSKIITKYYTGSEEKFVNRLKRMSLSDKLDVDIKGERRPYIKYPGDTLWSGISLPQMSYGYEVEQTPLQVLAFYNAVANGGAMMQPRFVKLITDHGQVIQRFKPKVINPSICSKATIKKAQQMLEGVVENGTARNLQNSNYKIAGKTGTARIANEKYGYKYQGRVSYQASFVGYFPADNPKYSCIVVVNAPSSGVYYGNLVAGQVFKEIADKVYSTNLTMQAQNDFIADDLEDNLPYSKNGYIKDLKFACGALNIPINDEGVTSDWVATNKQDTIIKLYNRYLKSQKVPDVKGMGAKDALFILENLGLNVVVRGRGAVSEQSISPGSKVYEGTRIVIKLT